MKKKLISLILIALLMLSLSSTSFADTIQARTDLYVEYTSGKEIKNNTEFSDTLEKVQPRDDTTIRIAVKNTSGKTVDWYMLNKIISSLETDSSIAENGGYTYILRYKTSSGEERELYNSNKVGGGGQDKYTSPAKEGLKEIEDALKDYMFLERMGPGKSGMLTLYVALDGESMPNSYQDTIAKLRMRFAVEEVETNVVVTGDDPVKLSPAYIGMGVSGVVVLLLAIDGAVRNARKRKEPKH